MFVYLAEARARMTQELGLNGSGAKKNNINDDNEIDNNDPNGQQSSSNSNESIDADTEDVDALLANVDVDGASDISGNSDVWSLIE